MPKNTNHELNSNLEDAEHSDFRKGVVDWIKHNNPKDPGFLLPQTFMEVGSEQVLDFLRENGSIRYGLRVILVWLGLKSMAVRACLASFSKLQMKK